MNRRSFLGALAVSPTLPLKAPTEQTHQLVEGDYLWLSDANGESVWQYWKGKWRRSGSWKSWSWNPAK